MRNKIQRGFTMVELIVVIVILGILAAVALPKFMGLEREARVAAVKSMGGTLLSAAQMARGMCMAQNCAMGGAGIPINGNNIIFANGYPNAATIQFLIQSSEGFAITGGNRFTKAGATVNCWVQYNAAAPGLEPTLTYHNIVMSAGQEANINADLRVQC